MISVSFNKETKKKRKTEFSKKLLYVIFGVTGIIIGFSLYMMWVTQDLTPLSYLIPAIFTQAAVGIGFYYNKAKAENLIKLKQIYGEELVNEVENEVGQENY